MAKYLVVLAGAGLGGLARYTSITWILTKYGGRFPLGTFIINISGSFLIGVLMTLFIEHWESQENWRLFLIVGVLGGYTTFSSFEYETYRATRDGAAWVGLLYVVSSVVVGYCGVWLGELLAEQL